MLMEEEYGFLGALQRIAVSFAVSGPRRSYGMGVERGIEPFLEMRGVESRQIPPSAVPSIYYEPLQDSSKATSGLWLS